MNTKWILNMAAVGCLAIAPAVMAQDTPKEDKSADMRSVTGCLSHGDEANEYKVTGEDGSTWEVTSKMVKLSPHVGHVVAVSGKVWHPDMHGAKEKTKDAMDPDAKEHGHLNVTKLTMVSDSCKK